MAVTMSNQGSYSWRVHLVEICEVLLANVSLSQALPQPHKKRDCTSCHIPKKSDVAGKQMAGGQINNRCAQHLSSHDRRAKAVCIVVTVSMPTFRIDHVGEQTHQAIVLFR
jgi:hypothetical protein